MTAHAYALLDSYIYGFALQEASLPFNGPETVGDVAEPMHAAVPAGEYPHFVEMATEYVLRPGYDFGDEFEFGLTLILDALTRLIPGAGRSPSALTARNAGGYAAVACPVRSALTCQSRAAAASSRPAGLARRMSARFARAG